MFNHSRVLPRRLMLLPLMLFGSLALFSFARAATLTGTFEALPAGTNVNLTAEGKLDWVHWGLLWEQSLIRKYGHPPQIAYAPIISSAWDGPYWLGNSSNRLSWTDGTPTPAANGARTGIFFVGLNRGFQIQCPADTSTRRLALYVGASQARLQLTASLSDGSAPAYTNTAFLSLTNGAHGQYTVDFQADSVGQTLTVRVTVAEVLGSGNGVNLFAATLTGDRLLPDVAITAPANGAALTAPATFSVSASAVATSGAVTNLEIFRGTNRLAQSTNAALSLMLTNQPTNTYVFTARAVNDQGQAVTSAPVRVHVTTGGGMLIGRAAFPPANLNLSEEGQIDWAHWGLSSPSSFNRRAGVPQAIPDVVLIDLQRNKLERYADNFTAYTWTNGTPTPSATNTPTGIFARGAGKGFQLTVPASPTPRRLKVYVGLWSAQGKFEAALSDGSGPPYTDTSLQSVYPNAYAVHTLDYASRSASANLVIQWTATLVYDNQWGNVTWQAVTLAERPPPAAPRLVVNNPRPLNQFGVSFQTELGWNYTVLFADSLTAPHWQVLTNFPGTGAGLFFSDPLGGLDTRFYRIRVE